MSNETKSPLDRAKEIINMRELARRKAEARRRVELQQAADVRIAASEFVQRHVLPEMLAIREAFREAGYAATGSEAAIVSLTIPSPPKGASAMVDSMKIAFTPSSGGIVEVTIDAEQKIAGIFNDKSRRVLSERLDTKAEKAVESVSGYFTQFLDLLPVE